MTRRIVILSGTGTGVGKTWVGCELLRRLRREGIAVCARKPVQSFDPDEGATDADLLAAASGESCDEVCPAHRSYSIPMAPPIAADVLGRPPFTLAELTPELRLPETGLALIEGVGGPRSPLAVDGDTVALTDAVDADLVVLVAEPVLGTINSTLLAAAAFGDRALIVFLNRFRPDQLVHRTNREWLARRAGLRIVTDIDELATIVHELVDEPQPAGRPV